MTSQALDESIPEWLLPADDRWLQWHRLIVRSKPYRAQSGELWRRLQQMVRDGADDAAFEAVATGLKLWEGEVDEQFIFSLQLAEAERLVELARFAAHQQNTAFDPAELAMLRPQASCEPDLYCVLRGAGDQRGAQPGTQRALTVLVKHRDGCGCLARLELEAVPHGQGAIYADRRKFGFPEIHEADDFAEVIREVSELARRDALGDDGTEQERSLLRTFDLRYRLAWAGALPPPLDNRIAGRSAMAAFYLAALCACKAALGRNDAQLLDASAAITAELTENYRDHKPAHQLKDVDGLPEKLTAAAAGGLRLVVLSTEQKDLGPARAAAADRYPEAKLEVKQCATATEALAALNALVPQVRGYLQNLIAHIDHTPWYRRKLRLKVTDLAVEPIVVTENPSPEMRPDFVERAHKDADRTSPEPRHPVADEREAELRELPRRAEEREQIAWTAFQQRLGQKGRAVIKGAPGSGKTFLTRQTVIALAQQSLKALDEQTKGINEIVLPIRVTAQKLALAAGEDIGARLLGALADEAESFNLNGELRDWLRQSLVSSRAVILVDALDELHLSPEDEERFTNRTRELDALPGRVFLTCRTLQWNERKRLLAWESVPEIELALFKPEQQREFVEEFFYAEPARGASLQQIFERNAILQETCRTPLLLAFACLLHQEGALSDKTSLADLYQLMTAKLLRGEWRAKAPAWGERLVGAATLLKLVCWQMFNDNPTGNSFTHDQYLSSARAVKDKEWVDRGLNRFDFFILLKDAGVIQAGGFDKGEETHSFPHRTFFEFWAAQGLSQQPQEVWLKEVHRGFGRAEDDWGPSEGWTDLLRFLAASLPDATPLLEAFNGGSDDVFGSLLLLRAQLLGAAHQVQEPVTLRVCSEVFEFWRRTLVGWRDCLREPSLTMLVALRNNPQAAASVVEGLTPLLGDVDDGNTVFVPNLLEVEGFTPLLRDENSYVRTRAAAALGAMGAGAASAAVLARLTDLLRDKNPSVNQEAAHALGRMGAAAAIPEVITRLTNLLRDDYPYVRSSAADALGQMRGAAAIPEVIARLTQLLLDYEGYVRMSAAAALRRLTHNQNQGIKIVIQ